MAVDSGLVVDVMGYQMFNMVLALSMGLLSRLIWMRSSCFLADIALWCLLWCLWDLLDGY